MKSILEFSKKEEKQSSLRTRKFFLENCYIQETNKNTVGMNFNTNKTVKGQCKIYHMTWPVEKNTFWENIYSPRMKLLQKN